jgi:hypothetical protein
MLIKHQPGQMVEEIEGITKRRYPISWWRAFQRGTHHYRVYYFFNQRKDAKV